MCKNTLLKLSKFKKQKLPSFLIYKVLNVVKGCKKVNFCANLNLYLGHIRHYYSLYAKYKILFDLEEIITLGIYRVHRLFDKGKPVVFLFGSYIAYLISEVSKIQSTVVITNGKTGRIFSVRHKIPYFSLNKYYGYLNSYLKTNDEYYLYKMKEGIKNMIKAINPKVVVLWDDMHPAERMVLYVCKELNIPTINIQHGYYDENDPIVVGIDTDYVFVWHEYFKNMYVSKGVKAENAVRVLGYPYPTLKLSKYRQIKNILLISDRLEMYNPKAIIYKIRATKKLYNAVTSVGNLTLNIRCRGSEIQNKEFVEAVRKFHPSVKVTYSDKKNLLEDIKENDLFVSPMSTVLTDVVANGKISIQFLNFYPFRIKNMEKIGLCTKTVRSNEELEKLIQRIVDNPNIFYERQKLLKNSLVPKGNIGKRFIYLCNQSLKVRTDT